MRNILSIMLLLAGLAACSTQQKEKTAMQTASFIPEKRITEVIAQLTDSLGGASSFRIERGVQQVAALWRETDGTGDAFAQFCRSSFVADTAQLSSLFTALERNFEVLGGYFNKMDLKLKEPLQK